jgi:hypothetical protein
VRARNVNTIDEVPDSSWFTNRILARPLSVDQAARGPLTGTAPATGTWSVVRPKQAGFAPGFTMNDAKGETWFVSFDGKGHPEAATGAILVANKIFWALGYWQVENYLISVRPDQLAIADSATVTPPSGKRRQMRFSDLEDVLRRADRAADGSYRAVAARAVAGRPLGGFRYYGTRSDDPNDIVPHEHRRELRALKVFGAWTNLVDMKAGNTLDALVTANGRGLVRHYLQDVGSTFGTGANGPREYDEGAEHLFEGDLALKRMITFGFFLRPWQTSPYVKNRAIGRFEGTYFEPTEWKPRVATAAFLRARRRFVLGRASGPGIFGRHDSRDRQDRTVHRSASRTAPVGRADPAPRQDRSRLSESDQPGGQSAPGRVEHPLIRERRGIVRIR